MLIFFQVLLEINNRKIIFLSEEEMRREGEEMYVRIKDVKRDNFRLKGAFLCCLSSCLPFLWLLWVLCVVFIHSSQPPPLQTTTLLIEIWNFSLYCYACCTPWNNRELFNFFSYFLMSWSVKWEFSSLLRLLFCNFRALLPRWLRYEMFQCSSFSLWAHTTHKTTCSRALDRAEISSESLPAQQDKFISQ